LGSNFIDIILARKKNEFLFGLTIEIGGLELDVMT
jgi:hypothetical protein